MDFLSTHYTVGAILKLIGGALYGFVLYGYFLTWALFPRPSEIPQWHRFLYGVGLSVSLQPLLLFLTHRLTGAALNAGFILGMAIITNCLACIIYMLRRPRV